MKHPLRVSVVIPAYNAARFLTATLDSVAAQTQAPDEIIVVDDGSTDATPQLLASRAGIRVHRQANAGVAAARNQGVALSKGDLIAFLDADSLWYPDKLQVQVAHHVVHPEVAYSFVEIEEKIAEGVEAPWWSLQRQPQRGSTYPVAPSGLMITREAFYLLGGFDVSQRTGEDADFLLRARRSGLVEARLPNRLGAHVIHGENISTDRSQVASTLLQVLRKSIVARQRSPVEGQKTDETQQK